MDFWYKTIKKASQRIMQIYILLESMLFISNEFA